MNISQISTGVAEILLLEIINLKLFYRYPNSPQFTYYGVLWPQTRPQYDHNINIFRKFPHFPTGGKLSQRSNIVWYLCGF